MIGIQLNERQLKIIDIVKASEPITSEAIAAKLEVTRATLRSDLSVLTMTGILDARPKVGYFYSGMNKLNLIKNNVDDVTVGEFMSMPVVVKQDVSVYDVIVTMFLSDVGNIIITDEDDYLCGVVSRKDLLKSTIGGSDISKIPVGMIMTRTPNVITVLKEDSVLHAAKKIMDHEVDFLPVVEFVDNNNSKLKVLGKFSKTNLTRLFVELVQD